MPAFISGLTSGKFDIDTDMGQSSVTVLFSNVAIYLKIAQRRRALTRLEGDKSVWLDEFPVLV